MRGSRTRDALLEQGALLFARHGVGGVTTRQLHEAVGARNESALHYHFGGRAGLVAEIVRIHVQAVEARRAALVAAMVADDRTHDLRSLVHAFAAPMAADLGSPVGRAHLRLVAQLSHPSLAFEPPQVQADDTPARTAVVKWLYVALGALPEPVRRERLAALREQLITLFGLRAQLLDDHDGQIDDEATELFVENLLDMLVAGLAAEPSPAALAASARTAKAQVPSSTRRLRTLSKSA